MYYVCMGIVKSVRRVEGVCVFEEVVRKIVVDVDGKWKVEVEVGVGQSFCSRCCNLNQWSKCLPNSMCPSDVSSYSQCGVPVRNCSWY